MVDDKVLKKSKAIKNLHYLKLLRDTKKHPKQKLLIEFADKSQIDAIIECIINILQGRIPITQKHKKQLVKHKDDLRKLAKKKTTTKTRKKVLKQKGGLLGAVLPLAVGALSSILGNLKI